MNNRNGNIRGPYIFDSLDHPNPTQQPRIVKHGFDWRNTLILCVTGVVVLFSALFFVYRQLMYIVETSSNDLAVRLSSALLWILYAIPVILLLGATVLTLRYVYIMTLRAKLVNVMEHQLSLEHLEGVMTNVLKPFFEVMMEDRRHSDHRGVQTLTYDKSDRRTFSEHNVNTNTVDKNATPIATPQLIEEPGNKLINLKKKGLINRSNDSILIGFTNDET